MAVFKRITCAKCGRVSQTEKVLKSSPLCLCGGSTRISDKWYVSLQVEDTNGRKRKLVKAVSPIKKVAEEAAAKILTQRAEGEFFDKVPKLTFERGASIFIGYCRDRVSEGRLGDRTREMYEGRLDTHLISAFRGIEMARLSRDVIEQYKRRRMQEVKPATVNLELSTLKRMCVVLAEKGLIKVNPTQHVELLREDNKRDRFLTESEIAKLLKECKPKPRLLLIVMIALNTGLRLSGCLTLRWSEIDFKRNQITKVVKGGKTVFVPINDEFRSALLAHRGNVLNPNGYVIPSSKKKRGGACLNRTSDFGFRSACARAGIKDFRFHDLRHTFATHFLARTKDIYTLSHILGHSTVSMTERYAHLLDDVRREAMKQFGGFK
ncbi:MAG: tyrosine-type recombinase/integrase [Syntrophobacteraceae bacterium]